MANSSNYGAAGAGQIFDTAQGPSSGQSAAPVSVTITDNGDGTYAVSMNQDQDSDTGDGDSGQDGGDEAQQADSLVDALEIAGEMLSGQAAQGGDEQGDSGSGDDSDDSAPLSAAAAKGYWRQMAARKKYRGPM
jgi:hypothetical protein